MSEPLDLGAIEARYSAALDARPSKGAEIGSDGYTALTDSVADLPTLLAEVERLRAREERVRAVIAESQRITLTVSRNDALLAALDGAQPGETKPQTDPWPTPPKLNPHALKLPPQNVEPLWTR